MNDYRNLKIWNKGMELAVLVYGLAKLLPSDEKFGLVSQIKRCSISIPSNIAEGAGRNSKKEFIHFLSISNGSTFELETQLLLIERLKLIAAEKIRDAMDLSKEIKNMNFSLQRSLKRV